MLAGGGYDLGLMLDGDADRAGAADEQGTFIHQLEVTGLLMYYLAEHRGLREPVVTSVNNTSMAARLGEHYGIKVYETSVGFKYIGPKMIETGAMMGGEESGGFGFGMHLPERDGVYADLLLLDLFLRERAAGRWPVSKALAHFHELAGPSFYRRIDVHVAKADYPGVKERLLVVLTKEPPASLAGQPVVADPDARHRRRLEVLRRRRVVDARPDERDGAAGPRLHGGDVAGDPRRDGRRGRAPGPRSVTERRRSDGSRSPGATSVIWSQTDHYVGKILFIAAGRRLSLQKHLVKDESILVLRGRLRLHLEDADGVVRTSDLEPGEHRHVAGRADPPLRGGRRGRASWSRCRRPNWTTSSASRTTSGGRGRALPEARTTAVRPGPVRARAGPRRAISGVTRDPMGVGFGDGLPSPVVGAGPDGGPVNARYEPGRWRVIDDAQLSDRQGREGKSLRPRVGPDHDSTGSRSRSRATTTPITSRSTPRRGIAPATTSRASRPCVHTLSLQKILGVMLPEEAQVSIFTSAPAELVTA